MKSLYDNIQHKLYLDYYDIQSLLFDSSRYYYTVDQIVNNENVILDQNIYYFVKFDYYFVDGRVHYMHTLENDFLILI